MIGEAPPLITAAKAHTLEKKQSPVATRCHPKTPPVQRSPVAHRSTSIKKLGEQDHFHYSSVELGPVVVSLVHLDITETGAEMRLQVESNARKWRVTRSFEKLCEFDCQLHRCVFDRSHSRLRELREIDVTVEDLHSEVERYFARLSQITGSLIRCFPVLRFLEVDSRGNRFLPAEETPINTPAIATAIVTKDYEAQSCDQISLKVGDIVSIIEKASPGPNGHSWWKAKLTIRKDSQGNEISGKHFHVGVFPSECVKIFDGKSDWRNETEIAQKSPPRRPRQRSLMRTLLGRNASKHIPVFGTDLVEYLQKTGDDVPNILKKCVEFIEAHGIVTGVYRQCGIQSNIQKLRNGFDSGNLPNLNDETILRDVHCVSSLLKQYFRQLPNPLFTFELYPDFIAAYETTDESRAHRFKSVVDRLPPEHYRTAKYLILHLSRLCQCTHLTDMNSKNLAIVWAPNLFRCPPCQSGSDSYLLQGLNVQTGLCNFILVHAVYLFSLEKESLTLLQDGASPPFVRKCTQTASPDLSNRNCIDVNGGPSSLPTFRTVLERPSRKLSAQPGAWRRLLRGPSVDNAITSLRNRWRNQGEQVPDGYSALHGVKWRRSPSVEASSASFRQARSASLISFVTKSVEEFRNGVMRGWRTRAISSRHGKEGSYANVREPIVKMRATDGGERRVRRDGVLSAVELEHIPSTLKICCPMCQKMRKLCTAMHKISAENLKSATKRSPDVLRANISETNSSTRTEPAATGNSSRASSRFARRKVGLEDDENGSLSSGRRFPTRPEDGSNTMPLNRPVRTERRVAFDSQARGKSFDDINRDFHRSSSSPDWSASQSSESLQLDMSRYDNVSPHLSVNNCDNGSRFIGTPISFYDLPHTNNKANRSNVQLYFL
uniref:Rho-GAP domain-containing protein n=1 Tax=Ascaris lumbricoides TaxID=6252 RepID=A0A9J2P2J0_ASCLU